MLGKTANRVLRALAVAGAFLLLPLTAAAQYVIGPGPGGTAPIMFIEPSGTRTIDAFPGFLGGMSVTLGDVNGDGVADVIAGAGPGGGPHVKVFNGTDLSELRSFLAFDPGFTGGVHVAAGDINGDGSADIIVGAGAGAAPHVRVFSGADLSELASFFAYNPLFNGGVTVAAGDVNGDGRADIVTGVGEGGGPHVRVLSGLDLSELAGFFAYDPAFDGGVFVAAGDLDGDGLSDIVTGAGPGGGPHVKVFSGLDQSELASFFGFDPAFTGGVSVATGDIDGDGRVDLILGAGDPHVRILSGVDLSELASFLTPPGFGSSISVGSIGDAPGVRFTSPATTTFTVGSPGSFTVTTAGGPVPAITSGGTLPAGVTFTDNGDRTATLAGTPAAGSGGSYALTFTADNGIGTPRTQTFTLTVNEAPAITSGAATTFTIGAAGTFAVTTSGFPLPAITRTGATLPAGVTWTDNGNGTGTLSGTPDAGSGGTYAITFTADNGVGAAATQTFTLTVNGAPAFTSVAATTFTVGSAGTFSVTTVATPAATLTVGALPAGVSFVDNGNGTGTLGGTPAAGTGGTHTLTFTATNSVGSATQSFTLTVNEAPAITSATSATFALGAPNTFPVTTRGFPLPTIAVTGTLPTGVTFQANPDGTGTLSGTPTGPGGIFPLTFTATNSLGTSAPQAFTLTVNGPPSFTSANTTTFTAGTPGTFTVTTIGSPTPVLTVSGSLPNGVTFTPNPDGTGTLSGTPGATTGGSYALTFTAANGVLPDATQAFTLIVNQAPAITSAAATTFTVGSAGSFTVTTTGFPVPTLARGGVALPAGVNFTDNGNGTGTLSGTPAAGTGGTYAITFTATNTVGATAPQAFTLTVNQAPAFTSAAATAFTVGVAGTFSITTSGFPAITAITRGGVALPAGVNYTDNGNGTATLAGTPAAGTGGTYALTFTINNGVGGNVVQNFTLTINAPPAITSATSTTFTVGTPGTFTVTTTGFPTPTVSQTGTLPTGVTFTPATNVLAGTATQTGTFPLVFTATNAIPPDATQNFTLNVICPTITVNPATMPEGLFMVAYPGVTFTQTGSTGSTITWSATGLPAGLTISPTTGAVTGTPTNTVLNAAVVITATDNFGCPGTRSTTITVRPVVGTDAFTGGVGNTQFVVGASVTTPAVVKAGNVKGNDSGPGTLTVTFNAPASGAVAEGPTDGTFVYTPNVAFGGPTDTFTYTLTDGNGVTNTGTVTIALSGIVWYVNSAGGAGDGRSHNPFNTLNAAATPSAAGSQIYVHTGTGTTTGDLTMDASQTLHGAGGAFALNDLIIGAAGKPTLGGTVTVANGSLIQFVNFVTGATAISGNGTNGLTVNDVDISGSAGTGTGIALTNVSGTIDLNDVDFNSTAAGSVGLSLTNVTGATDVDSNSSFASGNGAEVLINGGTGNVTIAAPITSTAGRLIDIQNRTSGTVTFTGAITDTGGTGILLNNNGTSTFSFSGGLTLNGAGTTFTATNASLAGTLTITGTNTIGATTPPTSGTALNVSNINIGASGLTFRSIAANGATSGIVLNSTGALGSLSVTGTGSASSGGIIQFTTGAGISLTNTLHPQFAWMNIHDIGQNGIDGQQVTNFTLTNSIINNVGTAAAGQYNENNIAFNDAGAFTSSSLSGTVTITNNTLTNARRHGIQIENGTGTIANLTISNNVLTSSTSAAASLGTAILVLAQGSATLNAHVTTGTIASNTITNFPSGEGIFIGGGAGNVSNNTSSTLGANGTPISITGNAISGQAAAGQHLGSNAIRASFNGQVGVANFSITNNGTAGSPITNIQGQGISVFMGGTVTGTTTINNNVIVANQTLAAGTQGLAVQIDDGPAGTGTSAADYNVVITNNSVSAYEGNGIRAIARASLGKMDVTIQNNTVGTPILANRNGIRIDSGSAVGDVTTCLAISGNTSDGSGVNAGIGLRKQGTVAATNDFGIVGLSPSPTTGANAATRVATDNPAGGGVDIISGDNFTSCTITP